MSTQKRASPTPAPATAAPETDSDAERLRLARQKAQQEDWQRWGPYLSERQWGTVREDYSEDGTAWEYFPHDMARSRAYRWGEDGLAGISDRMQHLCLGLGLWNGSDPILKERIFGLTNREGNHGEDVKEYYYYLDATPTHSYLKMLYKYPQAAFPYMALLDENRRRDRHDAEFELIDTGVFDDDRYFDVEVEYAQRSPGDILMQITVANRGPEAAPLHVIPQCWARNTWSWGDAVEKPSMWADGPDQVRIRVPALGDYRLQLQAPRALLFCDNETNVRRLWGDWDAAGYFKDAINDYFIHGRGDAVNPERRGTKVAAHYSAYIGAGEAVVFRLRLAPANATPGFDDFGEILQRRRLETDAFYQELQGDIADRDRRHVQRQALAGMIWSKQFYHFDVRRWLQGDPGQVAPPERRKEGRNSEWQHLSNAEIISMPDKWEYPWYAAWDCAFHCLPLALVDAEFAKNQLLLLVRGRYLQPNGQLPANEWDFGDLNPPIHAWATWRVYEIDKQAQGGRGDRPFLERVFHTLCLNFTWWMNRKDSDGRSLLQGGLPSLGNIGVFDRSVPLPGGAAIKPSDGGSWLAMYALNMMRIALELALENPAYEDMAVHFFEHFLPLAEAMNKPGDRGIGLWDEQDRFFCDALVQPGGDRLALRLRSMVGIVPLFAIEVLEPQLLQRLPNFHRRLLWHLESRPELAQLVAPWDRPGSGQRRLLALLTEDKLRAIIGRMVDETEFLSDYGLRGLSRYHADHPCIFDCEDLRDGIEATRVSVGYVPGEATSSGFGGNSNWRGPIWFPLNFLAVEALQRFHHYYGDAFKVECPAGSGQYRTLWEVAELLSERLCRIFLRDVHGRRPVYGHHPRMQDDPQFADHLLFYEYFHGDTGRGVGANHHTGWTGCVATLLQPRRPVGSAP